VPLTALRATPEADSPVVDAGRAESGVLASRLLELIVGLQVALLITLVGWITWKAVGRALRPVEAIRAELAEITASDLSSRVPQPPGDDEIARLARTANHALERLERSIQQQRQFAADASHELRTPVAGIRAQLESARLHPDDHGEAIEAALRDTDRLEAIVTDLLFLARVGTSAQAVWERVDLGDLVTAEVKRRPGRPQIEVELAPHVTVNGVSTHLSRVLTNLLDNAERHAASAVWVEVGRADRVALLAVGNDGEPIPEEDRERIFERFARVDSARSRHHGGVGLGLAIARAVVEAHHGSIRVEDANPGVRFVIRLPLSPDDLSPDDAGPPPA
jgi:signal transduction histidine kinase